MSLLPTIDDPARIIVGDSLASLKRLPDGCVHCCVTSPPYWALRDYGCEGQIGLEKTPQEFIGRLVELFEEVRRVLHPSGTCWVNMGDSYAGTGKSGGGKQGEQWTNSGAKRVGPRGGAWQPAPVGLKGKDLVGIPWRLAFALQAAGWYLRSDIIWHKPSPMPESVTDRPTKSHEYVFLLTKNAKYFYDAEAIKEPGVSPEMSPAEYAAALRDTSESWYPRVDVGIRENGAKQDNNLTSGRTPPGGRNKRTVWTIASQPYPEAHFATFPPALVEPMILAGSSAKGVCPHCLEPWRRVVAKERKATRPAKKTKLSVDRQTGEHIPLNGKPWSSPEVGNRDPHRHVTIYSTTGWKQSCDCLEHKPIPATVLDPFLGSGTTLQVAIQLKRLGIGLELNPEYAKLAEKRLAEPLGIGGLFDNGKRPTIDPTLFV